MQHLKNILYVNTKTKSFILHGDGGYQIATIKSARQILRSVTLKLSLKKHEDYNYIRYLFPVTML